MFLIVMLMNYNAFQISTKRRCSIGDLEINFISNTCYCPINAHPYFNLRIEYFPAFIFTNGIYVSSKYFNMYDT